MSVLDQTGEMLVPEEFNFARDVVEAIAAHDSTWPALTFVDAIGAIRRFTFTEMNALATRWSCLLREHGVRPGDRLLVVVGSSPDWHAVLLGSLRCGAVSVPCPVLLAADDLAERAEQTRASYLIADSTAQPMVEQAIDELDNPPSVIYIDDPGWHLGDYPQTAPCEATYSDDVAFIVYTSGTAEEAPKAVVHTHASAFAMRVQAEYWLDARPDDLIWSTAETGWAGSIWNSFLGPWSCGAEIFLHERQFDARERLELVERFGVSVLCQTPAEFREMAELEDGERHDLSRLHHAVSTGEPLDPVLITAFRETFGITIHDGYGQAENALLVANAPGSEIRTGAIGRPTPGHDVAVIDEDGREVPPGVEGEIAVRGRPPSLFLRYWDAPEETEARFRDDWYLTGDRATRDYDGYFWLKGREEDMIVSAGYRFGPHQLESALQRHDAVAESAVIGKPDRKRGQIAKAFVVLQPGIAAELELAAELEEHCKLFTPPYEHLGEVEFVDSLPKTANGKIRRADLRRREEDRARTPDPVALRAAAGEKPRPMQLGSTSQQDAARRPARRKREPKPAVSVSEPTPMTDEQVTPLAGEEPEESPLVSRLHAYERADDQERVDPRAFVVPTPPLDFGEARAARARKKPRPRREESDAGAPPD